LKNQQKERENRLEGKILQGKGMKAVKSKTIVFIFGAVVMSLSGCTSTEEYYNDVGLSRESAYKQWKGRKEQEDKSQVVISGQLSLQDCIKLTLVNNKTLQRVAQDREIARGQELGSYSAMLPSVVVSVDYLRKDKVSSIGPFTIGDVDNYSMALRVTQPIFAGGSIIASMNAARLFRLMTDQTVRATTQDVLYAAEHAYYDVMLNQHLLEISNDAVRSSQAHLDSVKQKREQGVASDFDVLRAEVELSNFQADLIKNKNAINISKTNLLKIMGVSQDSEVAVSAEFVYEPTDITRDDAVQLAFRNRPGLFSREFAIKYQKEMLNISKSRYFPVVAGFYETSRAKPDPHNPMLIDWGNIWSAGGSITLPLFDGFAREGEVIAQKARLKQAQIDLVDGEETALFELNEAMLSIENAAEFVDSQKLNLTRAKEGLRLAEVGYREGTNTQVEMIDAQSALTQAKVNFYQSIYTHNIAKLDLQKAMGTLAVPADGK
jgi:outer membrane protein TolC